MSTGTIVLIVTLLIMVAAIVALYFMGKKAQARKEEQDAFIKQAEALL